MASVYVISGGGMFYNYMLGGGVLHEKESKG
ncbi:hypothetical protein SAMN04488587_1616 [Methanococcoides vulcani]|uniref:Uncharacterized protein n=1 Tax=Methanococcoides vulcani TaxID=1353158 RepID=A0A1I0AEI2_9EURY|nr:hypothetical protein SAMN04488587_1616 [Methanococcoides vulcani]